MEAIIALASRPLKGAMVAMLLLWSTAASAQYRRTPGDTVRIRELTSSRFSATGPSGVIEVHTEHDAVIAVSFGRTDSATAWYESLRITARSPQGTQEPSAADALRRPFVLSFDARGRIETLQTPPFPASFEGVSDLSRQFDDLFPVLPSRSLQLGVEWTDTIVRDMRPAAGGRSRATRLSTNRVVGDSTINGEDAWLVASTQRHAFESQQPVKGQPLTMHTSLTGADSGVFVFSKAGGRLLGRRRTGDMTGTLRYEGGPRPIELPVRQRYENVVMRVPSSPR